MTLPEWMKPDPRIGKTDEGVPYPPDSKLIGPSDRPEYILIRGGDGKIYEVYSGGPLW